MLPLMQHAPQVGALVSFLLVMFSVVLRRI